MASNGQQPLCEAMAVPYNIILAEAMASSLPQSKILPVAQPQKWHTIEWLAMHFKGFDPIVDLEWRLQQEPGMEDKTWTLVNQGITSWGQLGIMSGRRWRAVQNLVPQKRLSHIHIDIHDVQRLGPGHMHNLDKLRLEAYQDL